LTLHYFSTSYCHDFSTPCDRLWQCDCSSSITIYLMSHCIWSLFISWDP
jgi:hypothetical protein